MQMRVSSIPKVELSHDEVSIQMTQWRPGAVRVYVWLGNSSQAIETFQAETFERAIELLRGDTVDMLNRAAAYLSDLQLPSGLTTGSTMTAAPVELADDNLSRAQPQVNPDR